MQRRIEKMANVVEGTFTSEFQQCMFATRLEGLTFGSSNILMAYVRFHRSFMNDTVDEFLFDNYLKTDSNIETTFSSL